MSDASEKPSERDEIEALLPWYVSGKLDAKNRARVERYIADHADVRAHLALAREEADATVAANEAIDAPGANALARLRASVARTMPRRQPLFAQLSERFADWIASLAPPQLGLVAAAAALVLMLQAAAIGVMVMQRAGEPTYQTATGDEDAAGDTIDLLVGFSDTTTMGEISVLLKEIGAVVADGPKAGLYRLRLPDKGEKDREAAIEFLKESGMVTVVLPGR
jgi:anti-sigma-K factor RskA